jgi:HKD family nuclease
MPVNFISGEDMGEEIRKLVEQSDEFLLAVAFWGDGVTKEFGLTNSWKQKKGTVICNLMSGACNPKEIEKLRKNDSLRVLKHDELHAKVYWTPRSVIIGSSNASSNGLAYEGSELAGWVEGNVKITEPKTVTDVKNWLAKIEKHATEIDQDDLNLAFEIWKKRRKDRHGIGATQRNNGKSFIKNLIENPKYFKDLQIEIWIYEGENMDPPAAKAVREAAKERRNLKIDGFQDIKSKVPPGLTIIDCSYSITKKGKRSFRPAFWRMLEDGHIQKYPKSKGYKAGKIFLCKPIKEICGFKINKEDILEIQFMVEKYLDVHPKEFDFTLFELVDWWTKQANAV